MENALKYMPLLKDKPHILVLNHPVMTYMTLHAQPEHKGANRSRLVDHPNAKRFVMIALNNQFPGLDTSHVINAPQLFHVHWSRGSPPMRAAGHFDAHAALKSKTQFASECFLVRYDDRIQIHK